MVVNAGDGEDQPHTVLNFATEPGPLIVFYAVNANSAFSLLPPHSWS